MIRLKDLRTLLANINENYVGHPDVTLIGIGEKYSGDVNTKKYAVIFYVERKGEHKGDEIPRRISSNGISVPTDVVELPAANLVMSNAVLDGSDILIDTSAGRSGTLGFVAFESGGGGRVFGITNSHVVAKTGENATGRDISTYIDGVQTVIGQVAYNTVLHDDGRLNKPDVSLISLNERGKTFARAYQIEPWAAQPIDGVSSLSAAPQAGARRPHEYASKANQLVETNFGRSPFEVTNLPMIAPDTGRPIHFERAFHTRTAGAVRAGHSGSAVTRLRSSGASRALTGLVVGGRERDLFAFAWSDVAATIKNDFGVDF